MSATAVGILGILILLGAIFFLRIPVGFAMAMVGFLGFWKVINLQAALGMISEQTWEVFSSYGLTVIPLFILMGQICFYAGVNQRMYRAAHAWLGHVRGGLAMATVLACAGFAAICGSNTATAATMSSVALPEMKKYAYSPMFSSGVVASGATLGVLIPPSVVLIIIGLQTGQSIGVLFWASLGPGLVLSLLFLLAIWAVCTWNPSLGPGCEHASWTQRLRSLAGAVEMLLLFALIMVGLMVGFFTPTEAGAAGAALALIISMAGRRLSWTNLWKAFDDTLRISCMIMVIILGAVIFGRFLTVTRVPYEISGLVASMSISPVMVMACIFCIYLLGGAIMDALALLLITIPIFFPVAQSLGYDPAWFAVWITLVTTMGAVTPPVGINTFIVASMDREVSLAMVYKGVGLLLPCFVVCVVLLLLWPDLALWLPRVLGVGH
ncbi:TRAP transporter large permease [Desulfovermiculus halophilus]|jgi:tripartite ATP-independent transporter DctM subunit|uniref:TRAP transporter large permease n=1 Tax=Desulfovermiculus halophilus TaxID=339722 RepID=UPI000480700F|nr:TRAP transporter large permease [Desulfovermiculus halophilus]